MSKARTLDIESMRAAAVQATSALRTLANPDRLLLLCQLTQGEKSVGELADLLGIVQPTLSQQLGVLRQEEMVETRRVGKQIYYSVKDQKVLTILNQLYSLYCENNSER
ncbi:metalloregulator ArsR/SmtB family transcription factor [Propionivibrio sp.]|uniref:ArsR/SmtB family transcription factor n=1 Tax=Propionivibrio sp. TaxID=2212460 RepID=UPI00261581D4|nr:metalloregulator ArsR/SmtB family transcription factor [Propionivibrio sp.]